MEKVVLQKIIKIKIENKYQLSIGDSKTSIRIKIKIKKLKFHRSIILSAHFYKNEKNNE